MTLSQRLLVGFLMASSLTSAHAIPAIKLLPGFQISEFASVENARQLAVSPSGTVFVGTRTNGNVFAVKDTNGDGVADKKWTVARGLNSPNGVAFRDGSLFIAEINQVSQIVEIEKKLDAPPKPKVVSAKFPTESHHGWKYIKFGPDGFLYVPVGAPCNVCTVGEKHAAIFRMAPDGSKFERVAQGVRNTVGFDWHPKTKQLWFTENGRDMLGDDIPADELNVVKKNDAHFGFPACHAGTIKDPDFGRNSDCSQFEKPVALLGAHVAALGMIFYTGKNFPDIYQNQILIAEHGSWNRSSPVGYKVVLVTLNEDGTAKKVSDFATGWLSASGAKSGRPVDLLQMPDGSVLLSDDEEGKIFRISYK